MKKSIRILALVLVLIFAVSLVTTTVLAGSYYEGNGSFSIRSGKNPWYLFWKSPSITVKNVGSAPASIYVYTDSGRVYKSITNLKKNKKVTFKLKKNTNYVVGYSCNPYVGGSPELYVTGSYVSGY